MKKSILFLGMLLFANNAWPLDVYLDYQTEFYDLLSRLNHEMNIAIVLVSHDITAISKHVNKIACLNQRLYYHGSKELTNEDIEKAYGCPVEMIAHGTPHRVLKEHD